MGRIGRSFRIIVTVELAVLAAAAARLRQWTGLRHAAAWLAVAGLFAAASFLAPTRSRSTIIP